MTLTLSKVMLRAWREIGHSVNVLATGGSTSTIIDTLSRYTSDDALVGGTAIVVRDAGGAGAAPEGEFSRITDYVASTTTFTVSPVFSAAVAAGDSVDLVRGSISYTQMIQAVNDGLANLGTITLIDTSLSTVAAQREYALPVGLKIKRIIDVLLQTKTGDTDDNRYESILSNVRFFPAAPGSTGLLELLDSYPSGRTMKIVYEGVHPTLTTYSSTISETIQEELAVAAAVDKALTWFVSKRGDSALGTFALQRWNDAKQTLQMQKTDKPVMRVKPKAKFFVAGSGLADKYIPPGGW